VSKSVGRQAAVRFTLGSLTSRSHRALLARGMRAGNEPFRSSCSLSRRTAAVVVSLSVIAQFHIAEADQTS
jgi:hypothetical protein